MKRPLYYLLCAIACTSIVGATMPIAAAAEAIQTRKPLRTRRKPLIQPAMPTRPKAASAQIEFRQASSTTFNKSELTQQH